MTLRPRTRPSRLSRPFGSRRSWLIEAAFATAAVFGIGLGLARPSLAQPAPDPDDPPLRPSATQLHLPILGDDEGEARDCAGWIEVQNAGSEPSKAILVTWGDPGLCPPQAGGPLKVECSGLITPGSRWTFSESQIPTGSRSAALYSFSVKLLSELGLDDELGKDDVVADYMCEELFFGVVGDADDYRRFKAAYDTGGVFRGVPQQLAAGSPLAAFVHRGCPIPSSGDGMFIASYSAVPGSALGRPDPKDGGFNYYIAYAAAGRGGESSRLHVQNASLDCASVELWFRPQPETLDAACDAPPKRCATLTIPPGESRGVDIAASCAVADTAGSLWLRSGSELAAVIDTRGGSSGASVTAATAGARSLVAPLIYHEYSGWDTRIHVQNQSPELEARVRVAFLDRSGDTITTVIAQVCPRGSRMFELASIAGLPGNWVGSARIESQPLAAPGGTVPGPDILGSLELVHPAADGAPAELVQLGLLPAVSADSIDADQAGAGLVALPAIIKGRETTRNSEIAIANTVSVPGYTNLSIMLFDQNGLLDFVCTRLMAQQIEYIDLATWGILRPGFAGSAVLSATYWEHDQFDAGGNFVANPVGLGAVMVERGTTLVRGSPITEASGTEGIALASADNPGFHPEGAPLGCPGDPPRPTRLPATATAEATATIEATATAEGPPLPATPTPTARPTDPPTPEPSPTTPPTSTVPAAAATATPIAKVCETIRPRVPAEVLDAALANPAAISGYNQLQYPNRPPGPFNLRRAWLTLADPGRPWNRLYNGLVFKVGCR